MLGKRLCEQEDAVQRRAHFAPLDGPDVSPRHPALVGQVLLRHASRLPDLAQPGTEFVAVRRVRCPRLTALLLHDVRLVA